MKFTNIACICIALSGSQGWPALAQGPTWVRDDFAADPNWESYRSRLLPSPLPITRQEFGLREVSGPDGSRRAVGGWIQRSLTPAWFAKIIPQRTLNERLSASGTFTVTRDEGASGTLFGWFNASSKTNKMSSDHQAPQTNLLAILIEGPSRVGHYFRPAYRTAAGLGLTQDAGPIIRPDGRVRQWSLRYSPRSGVITVRLDEETQTLAVDPTHRKEGMVLDRFGVFNLQVGGHFVDFALDDLAFTGGAE